MKPNRPHFVHSTRNYITVGWDSCDSLILKKKKPEDSYSLTVNLEGESNNKRWYILEKKDRVLNWHRTYIGFKTQTKIGPLAPGNYYEFRVKTATKNEESDWSDVLFAATKDDVISVAQLHRAVENGPVASLRKILSQRISCVDVPNRHGASPLRLAIYKNNTNFMGILLNHGADIGNVESGTGRTPLMLAAQRGQLEAVQLLLEKGSSWETIDRNGLTALNYAVDNSHLSVVQLAVEEGADVKKTDRFGWTSLMRGVLLKSSVEVLNYLLDNGSDPNEADNKRQTVLMQAVLSGRPEIVKLLLKKGSNINVKNIYGHSAYDMAKSSTNGDIIKIAYLLENKVKEVSSKKVFTVK